MNREHTNEASETQSKIKRLAMANPNMARPTLANPTTRWCVTGFALALLITTWSAVGSTPLSAAERSSAAKGGELFEKQIRPALLEHCIRCHGPDKQRGGLRLDSAAGWASGGDSGPAITPGDGESLLLKAIRYEDANLEMPPKGKLPSKTIEAFEQWVALGASDPRAGTDPTSEPQASSPSVEQGRSFWAFQPRRQVTPPPTAPSRWPASDIDQFILGGLQREGLSPNPPADHATLLRRVHYDLVGLPPTPEEIRQFLKDANENDSPDDALSDVVDRLLQSPQFGERWGRHWLDVVRFAESSGGGRSLLLPDAWRFRDYVIDSFNRDVPYNRFLMEQIAGDLLPGDDWREQQRNLIATGFLLLGPTNYEMQDKDILEMDVVDEQLDTIGKAFLGMTIGCARCHDHKFDPIPANDYYAMAGIFKSTKSLIHSNVSAWNTVPLPLPEREASRLASHQQRLQDAKQELQRATQRWKQAGGDPKQSSSVASIAPEQIHAIVLDDRDAELVGSWKESTSIARYVGSHYLHDLSEARGQKRAIYSHSLDRSGEYEILISYSPGSNRASRVPVHVRHAGGETTVHVNQRQPPPIERAFISIGRFSLDAEHPLRVIISNEGTDDGVVIADAVLILDPSQRETLLAKRSSAPPGNREERDRLKAHVDQLQKEVDRLERSGPDRPVAMAVEDREDASDIPLAIRGVVGQHGEITPRGVMQVTAWEPFPELEPGCSGRLEFARWISDARHPLTARVIVNRVWYWMMGQGLVRTVDNFGSTGEPPTDPELLDYLANTFIDDGWSIKKLVRRIALSRVYQMSSQPSAESPEDPSNRYYSRMNRKRLRAEDIRDSILKVAGSLDEAFAGSTIKPGTKIEYGYEFDALRRSVYLPVFRNALPEVFEVFDFADPNIQRGARSSSTIASQALWMMNHPTVLQQSQQAAARLLQMPDPDDASRIEYAYLQVVGRPPSAAEMEIAKDLIHQTEGGPDPTLGWAMLYQALFQCIDFRYLN